MTTAKRIVITQDVVQIALAAWHAHYASHTEPQRADAMAKVEMLTSGEYARQNAPFLFELLEKYTEEKAP